MSFKIVITSSKWEEGASYEIPDQESMRKKGRLEREFNRYGNCSRTKEREAEKEEKIVGSNHTMLYDVRRIL